jgi:hypothetical protein
MRRSDWKKRKKKGVERVAARQEAQESEGCRTGSRQRRERWQWQRWFQELRPDTQKDFAVWSKGEHGETANKKTRSSTWPWQSSFQVPFLGLPVPACDEMQSLLANQHPNCGLPDLVTCQTASANMPNLWHRDPVVPGPLPASQHRARSPHRAPEPHRPRRVNQRGTESPSVPYCGPDSFPCLGVVYVLCTE